MSKTIAQQAEESDYENMTVFLKYGYHDGEENAAICNKCGEEMEVAAIANSAVHLKKKCNTCGVEYMVGTTMTLDEAYKAVEEEVIDGVEER